MVAKNGYPYSNGYPAGQPTYFGPGFNYGLFVNNNQFATNATISWRIDGNIVEVAFGPADAVYRCPRKVKLVSEVTVDCVTENLQQAALNMRIKLIGLLDLVRIARGYQPTTLTDISLDAGILNCQGMTGEATFIVSDPPGVSDQTEASMFDFVFPLLLGRNLSTIASEIAGAPSLAVKPGGYYGVAKDEPIPSKKGTSALKEPAAVCDIEVIWCFTWLIFVIVVGCLFIFLILVIGLIFFFVRRYRQNSEKM
jgi:hypothetical protein